LFLPQWIARSIIPKAIEALGLCTEGGMLHLEKKYDAQFKGIFDAIRELMRPVEKDRRPIGFGPWRKSGSDPDF